MTFNMQIWEKLNRKYVAYFEPLRSAIIEERVLKTRQLWHHASSDLVKVPIYQQLVDYTFIWQGFINMLL